MQKLLHLTIVLLLFLISCSTNRIGNWYQQVDDTRVYSADIQEDDIHIELSYIGAIGHSFIFECYLKNNGQKPLTIDRSDFKMIFSHGEIQNTIDTETIVASLKREKKNLRKRKKSTTIIGGVTVGLSIIFGATQGANPAESLAFNADPIIGLFEERSWYDGSIDSVEDEIKYLRSGQFNYEVIASNEDIVRDVLFPTQNMNDDIEITANINGNRYSFHFPKKSFR